MLSKKKPTAPEAAPNAPEITNENVIREWGRKATRDWVFWRNRLTDYADEVFATQLACDAPPYTHDKWEHTSYGGKSRSLFGTFPERPQEYRREVRHAFHVVVSRIVTQPDQVEGHRKRLAGLVAVNALLPVRCRLSPKEVDKFIETARRHLLLVDAERQRDLAISRAEREGVEYERRSNDLQRESRYNAQWRQGDAA